MPVPSPKNLKKPSKELKEEYTNEFVLLGLFYFAQRYGHELGRKQTMKLLWKFKDLTQQKLGLASYYTEAYKDKCGRFNKEFYDQLNNLKTADFIETSGIKPLEKFKISQKGKKVFESFDINDEKTKYAFQLVKSNLDYITQEHGKKSAELLEEEDHGQIENIDTLPKRDEAIILSSNLKPKKIRYKFLFDDQITLDWAIAISIGERKKTEKIMSDDLLPNNQEEMYKQLGL